MSVTEQSEQVLVPRTSHTDVIITETWLSLSDICTCCLGLHGWLHSVCLLHNVLPQLLVEWWQVPWSSCDHAGLQVIQSQCGLFCYCGALRSSSLVSDSVACSELVMCQNFLKVKSWWIRHTLTHNSNRNQNFGHWWVHHVTSSLAVLAVDTLQV